MLLVSLPFAGAISVLLTILHIVICVFLIFVVLLQRGRNQDLASAFGGGQSQANLAAMSTDDFLTRATKISAFAFMATSLLLALLSQTKPQSVLDVVPDKDAPKASAPATDASPAETSAPAATELAAPADSTATEAAPTEAAPIEVLPVPTEAPPTPATPAGSSGPT